MLVGRGAAQSAVDSLLAGARASVSDLLLVRGEPGIGKTALMRYATEQAADLQVLSTCGVESESTLPYGGLFDVLGPVVPLLETIPERQRSVLAGVLALGPPTDADRFTAAAGTLSVLAAAAESGPLLVAVDDAHWVDSASLGALLFAARRLRSEGVALLLASRDEPALPAALAQVEPVVLCGLDLDGVAALLRGHDCGEVGDDVLARIQAATGGNPLAVLEVVGSLGEAQLSGRESLPDPLRAEGVEHAFSRRLAALPPCTRSALVVAAAAAGEQLREVYEAMRRMGVDPDSLAEADAAGIVSFRAGQMTFRHPLMRSAAYHRALPGERRAAHQALADVCSASDTRRYAWHLARAAAGPDESAAIALAKAAAEADAQGAHDVAANAYEEAAGLSVRREDASDRLLLAAHAAHLAGTLKRALMLLERALDEGPTKATRIDIQHARGTILMATGDPTGSYDLLCAEAARIASVDPDRAAILLAEATVACFQTGSIATAVETSERAVDLAHSPQTAMHTALVRGHAMLLAGEPALAQAVVDQVPSSDVSLVDPAQWQAMSPFAQGACWLGRYDLALDVARGIAASARRASMLPALPYPLAVLSETEFWIGDWRAARANASEAVELASQIDQESVLPFALICRGRIAAAQGDELDARRSAERARGLAETRGVHSIVAYTQSLLGLLELGAGRPQAAIDELEPLVSLLDGMGMGHPAVVPWAPDLIEAYAHVGRLRDARDRLSVLEAQAIASDHPWARAAAARCAGLLAPEDEFEEHFRRSLQIHDSVPTPFERARTEAAFGGRLRRAGRRLEARVLLRDAVEAFDRLGALPWAELARRELAATGERRGPHGAHLERLTPRELQVALTIVEGATNREAAAALFLSTKTVEFHLRNVYRKLLVRSRSELVRVATRSPGVLS